jgi:hypothetical protein
MKGTSSTAYLCTEVEKVTSLDNPVQSLIKLGTDGAPGMAGRNSDVSTLITNDVKCSEFQFDDTPLLDTPGKSVFEVHRKECLYSGFRSCKFQYVGIIGSLKICLVTWNPKKLLVYRSSLVEP